MGSENVDGDDLCRRDPISELLRVDLIDFESGGWKRIERKKTLFSPRQRDMEGQA